MGKIIRLTESDLKRIVKRTIKEMEEEKEKEKEKIFIDFQLVPRLQKYRAEKEPEKDRDEFMDEIKTDFKNKVDPFDEMDPRERKRKISRMIDNFLSNNGY
jgi:hypothetical protein